jgi:hypothetical protein
MLLFFFPYRRRNIIPTWDGADGFIAAMISDVFNS